MHGCRIANAEFAEIFLWITGSAYAVIHDGDAVLSSALFQRRGLVPLGNLVHLSDTYCASAKVYGWGPQALHLPFQRPFLNIAARNTTVTGR